ncbi:TlpA disulfide reductase family protein [Dokdonella soli]|uniref:TlpA disulfide reductase family protein n=1 Tax=Dokdonella soli TaxID=529810 RepID=A0ABN1IQ16_9GAMM
MFNRTNLLILLIALAGALGGFLAGGWLHAPSASRADLTAKVGALATPFDLPDLAGQTHSLAEWRGKLVLVNFWASWCAPCVEEMPMLDRAQQQLTARGVQVIGIASDNHDATRAFLDRHPVRYPILINDPDHGPDVSMAYGNTRSVLPYSVLIGRDGHILAQRFGNFSENGLEKWLAPFF